MRWLPVVFGLAAGCGDANSVSGSAADTTNDAVGSTSGATGGGASPPQCSVDDGESEHMVAVSVGGKASLALSSHGRVACWGVGDYGECGPGLGGVVPYEPVWVSGLGCIKQIDTDFTSFALHDDGTVFAWGTEFQGELGDGEGSPTPFATPVPVLLSSPASSIESTRSGGRAQTELGTSLWGRIGLDGVFDEPIVWDPPPGGKVFATGSVIYELDSSGKARARGENRFGKVGDGTLVNRDDWVDVATEARFERIASESTFACGITLDHELYCWGDNFHAALGIGTIPPATTPPDDRVVPVPTRLANLSNVVDVDLAEAGGCAINSEGIASCWGSNRFLRFLDRDGLQSLAEPRVIDDLSPALSVGLGDDHVCVQRLDGTIWCRGRALLRGYYGDAPSVQATEMHFDFGGE